MYDTRLEGWEVGEMKPQVVLLASLVFLGGLASVPVVKAAEKKVVTVWDYRIHDKKYKQNALAQFSKNNPDIQVKYTSQVGSVYNETLTLALKVGEEADLFVPAGNVPPLNELVAKKVILALDDIAPDRQTFQAWKARFPEPFIRAAHVGGKMYTWPMDGAPAGAKPLFVNLKLFKEAGVSEMPKNWKEFREDAAKITQAGNGKYYGAAVAAKLGWSLQMAIQEATATVEGTPAEFIDYRLGRYSMADDGYRRSIDLWMTVKADGNIFPGDTGMEDETVKQTFATDRTAMVVGGWWNPGGFIAYNPDVEFDMELFPTSDGGPPKGYSTAVNPLGQPFGYYVSAKTKNPDAVWKVIQFLTSEQYQVGWVKIGAGVSVFPEFNQPEYFPHPTLAKFATYNFKWDRIKPILPPVFGRLNELMPVVHPDEKERLLGIWVGLEQFSALVEWESLMNKYLDEAIKTAQAKGIKVSREDLMFPDWVPTENYRQASR